MKDELIESKFDEMFLDQCNIRHIQRHIPGWKQEPRLHNLADSSRPSTLPVWAILWCFGMAAVVVLWAVASVPNWLFWVVVGLALWIWEPN